jgi:hypothetical protein
VKKVVTLESLRVPFITDGKLRILSFGSRDLVFKPDLSVVPEPDVCKNSGITVVQTEYQHIDMSDRGPDHVKTMIVAMLNEFLDDDKTHGVIKKFVPEMIEPNSVPEMTEPHATIEISAPG